MVSGEGRPNFRDAKEKLRVATQEADPTQFSPLPISEGEIVGETEVRRLSILESGGEQYIDITENFADSQALTARLFKGVLNVSDVVPGEGKFKGRYFSKIMPLGKIEKNSTHDEDFADAMLILALVGDWDRGRSKYNPNWVREGGKVVHYDFDKSDTRFFTPSRPEDFRDLPTASKKTLQILIQKTKVMRERVNGRAGRDFLRAIVRDLNLTEMDIPQKFYRHAEKGDSKKITDFLQKLLIDKTEILIKKASRQLQEVSPEETTLATE